MSDSISAYYDDVAEYEGRCMRFHLHPTLNEHGDADPYCEHAELARALEYRDNIRKGIWAKSCWTERFRKFSRKRLDAMLDGATVAIVAKSVSTAAVAPAPPADALQSLPAAEPTDAEQRFRLLEPE